MIAAVTGDPWMRAPEAIPFRWSMVAESLTRPYRVTISTVVLALLVPFYIFIGDVITPGRTLHAPESGEA